MGATHCGLRVFARATLAPLSRRMLNDWTYATLVATTVRKPSELSTCKQQLRISTPTKSAVPTGSHTTSKAVNTTNGVKAGIAVEENAAVGAVRLRKACTHNTRFKLFGVSVEIEVTMVFVQTVLALAAGSAAGILRGRWREDRRKQHVGHETRGAEGDVVRHLVVGVVLQEGLVGGRGVVVVQVGQAGLEVVQHRHVGPEGPTKGVGPEAEDLVVVGMQQEVLVVGNEVVGVGGNLRLEVVQGRGVGHEHAAERKVQHGLGVEADAEGLVVVVAQ
mmetsp:Transcript_78776/g.254511  ORF Transcript_78776/g.254511 Transcript_78776/m.254511 type:complete len:276 (+) Transcript_78776:189-1016(+)